MPGEEETTRDSLPERGGGGGGESLIDPWGFGGEEGEVVEVWEV